METPATEKPSFVFDDRNIRWYKLGDLEHFRSRSPNRRRAILRPVVNEDAEGGRMAGAVNTIGQSKRGGGDRSSRPAQLQTSTEKKPGHAYCNLAHRFIQTGGALKL